MIKHIPNLCLFLLPLTITYAIVSSVGTEGNHYRAPDSIGVSDQGLQKPNVN
jgi:hypothetical protein